MIEVHNFIRSESIFRYKLYIGTKFKNTVFQFEWGHDSYSPSSAHLRLQFVFEFNKLIQKPTHSDRQLTKTPDSETATLGKTFVFTQNKSCPSTMRFQKLQVRASNLEQKSVVPSANICIEKKGKLPDSFRHYYECESPCCIIGWKLLPCQEPLYLFLYRFEEEATLQAALSSQIGSQSLFKALLRNNTWQTK